MSKYIKLECSIFDMKEMLENRELFFSDECNKLEYSPIHNEIELAYIVSAGIHIYRQKTQEEIEAQEVEELAELLYRDMSEFYEIGTDWQGMAHDSMIKTPYRSQARVAIQWMKDKNNDQEN